MCHFLIVHKIVMLKFFYRAGISPLLVQEYEPKGSLIKGIPLCGILSTQVHSSFKLLLRRKSGCGGACQMHECKLAQPKEHSAGQVQPSAS